MIGASRHPLGSLFYYYKSCLTPIELAENLFHLMSRNISRNFEEDETFFVVVKPSEVMIAATNSGYSKTGAFSATGVSALGYWMHVERELSLRPPKAVGAWEDKR